MAKRVLVLLGLIAALGLTTPALMADHEGKENKHQHGNKHDADDERGWEQRDGYEYRTYGGGKDLPSGWSQGKKTGWKNCGMPPGQAKKYGCRSYVYEGRPYYYYQDDRHQIVIRRPIIDLHGSVEVR